MKRRHDCLGLYFVLLALTLFSALPVRAGALVIATVDNVHMRRLQALSGDFENAHPEIRLRWVVLEESELRRVASADIETQGGQFDVITIGMFKVPIWAARGWLRPIRPAEGFDVEDLLPNVREALSHQHALHALPLYGESTLLIYRKDLMRKAGLIMPARPTWTGSMPFPVEIDSTTNAVIGGTTPRS